MTGVGEQGKLQEKLYSSACNRMLPKVLEVWGRERCGGSDAHAVKKRVFKIVLNSVGKTGEKRGEREGKDLMGRAFHSSKRPVRQGVGLPAVSAVWTREYSTERIRGCCLLLSDKARAKYKTC